MREFYFEKLEVWKESRSLVKDVYKCTESFPNEEKYGIISQIRRASLSVSANIAEGMSRKTEKDKSRFINQSFSSAIEVINFLVIANDLELLNDELYRNLREQTEKITNQLNSLYNKFEQ